MKKPDINIDGQGFYCIQAETPRGKRFLARVQGSEQGTAFCDDTRMTQDIADGACAKGLTVCVNGQPYTVS